MKTVVLTFDDGLRTHYDIAYPTLSKHGFKGTIFASGERIGCRDHSEWNKLLKMDKDGFEIANHSYKHVNVCNEKAEWLQWQIKETEGLMSAAGISPPETFCYPGFHVNEDVKKVVDEMGYKLARSGCEYAMEFDDFQRGGSGCAYDPDVHSPFQVPCLGVFGDEYSYVDFVVDLQTKLQDGQVGIFCFHNIGIRIKERDGKTFGVDSSVEDFMKCIEYLSQNKDKYNVVNFRDII